MLRREIRTTIRSCAAASVFCGKHSVQIRVGCVYFGKHFVVFEGQKSHRCQHFSRFAELLQYVDERKESGPLHKSFVAFDADNSMAADIQKLCQLLLRQSQFCTQNGKFFRQIGAIQFHEFFVHLIFLSCKNLSEHKSLFILQHSTRIVNSFSKLKWRKVNFLHIEHRFF